MNYTPTLPIKETAANIKNFVAANQDLFKSIFKPLVPLIVAGLILDLILGSIIPVYGQSPVRIGGLLITYLYTALAINWHRIVILGPDKYQPMDIKKPTKNEKTFFGMAVLLGVGLSIAAALIGAGLGKVLGASGIYLSMAIVVAGLVYIGYKVSFYFAAKAVDTSITLQESFAMTEGYVWEILGSVFMAALKLIGLMMLYVLFVIFGGAIVLALLVGPGAILTFVMTLLSLPLFLHFQPRLIIIGVTAVSNYYMHALQSRKTA